MAMVRLCLVPLTALSFHPAAAAPHPLPLALPCMQPHERQQPCAAAAVPFPWPPTHGEAPVYCAERQEDEERGWPHCHHKEGAAVLQRLVRVVVEVVSPQQVGSSAQRHGPNKLWTEHPEAWVSWQQCCVAAVSDKAAEDAAQGLCVQSRKSNVKAQLGPDEVGEQPLHQLVVLLHQLWRLVE